MEKTRIRVYRNAAAGAALQPSAGAAVLLRSPAPASDSPAQPASTADTPPDAASAETLRLVDSGVAVAEPPARIKRVRRGGKMTASATTGLAPWDATSVEAENNAAGTGSCARLQAEDREEARNIFPPHPGRAQERPSPVTTALELLAGGHSDLSALRSLREGHNLSLEQAQAALETAYQKLADAQGRGLEQKMALAVEQRSRIAAAAMDQSDYRIALTALEQRDKLLGLTGPEALGGSAAASSLLQLLQEAATGSNLTGPARPHP